MKLTYGTQKFPCIGVPFAGFTMHLTSSYPNNCVAVPQPDLSTHRQGIYTSPTNIIWR